MATRRSPRSIERLCNGVTFEGLDTLQNALLISLCQCTGWSADRIALKMQEIMQSENQALAEDVWNFHWEWVTSRGGNDTVSPDENDIMMLLMHDAGVELESFGKPLNRTINPTSVQFRPQWSPKKDKGEWLLIGYTKRTRDYSKEWLETQKLTTKNYGTPTSWESGVMRPFGPTVDLIMRDTLKRWTRVMRTKLQADEPKNRPLREQYHVMLIMQYLDTFRKAFEENFGLMEHTKQPGFSEAGDDTVYIQSTGYAAKVLLGLMMADRLHVIFYGSERTRRQAREKIGFEEREIESLPEDTRVCTICHEALGVENPDGVKEDPIELVICCGQYIGKTCLKTWLGQDTTEDKNVSCPTCRHEFPDTFIYKLYGWHLPAPEEQSQVRRAPRSSSRPPLRTPWSAAVRAQWELTFLELGGDPDSILLRHY